MNQKQTKQLVVKQSVALMKDPEDHPSLKLEDISMSINVSKFKICRCFQIITGTSPMRWYLLYRTFYAAQLIKHNRGLSIEEVSLKAGFKSSSHFTRSFQSICELSPSQYKSKCTKPSKHQNSLEDLRRIAIAQTMSLLQKESEFFI